MLKKIMIHITSRHIEVSDSLFEYMYREHDPAGEDADEKVPLEDEKNEPDMPENEPIEISTEGRLRVTREGTVILSYDETEMSGMEGAHTSITFENETPGLVTMMRTGNMNTALVFEENSRHICVYRTPYMPFELCVHTLHIGNYLLTEGRLDLDYIIEFRGAKAEHNLFTLTVTDAPDRPVSLRN